jgi:hypothetical protein
VHTTLESPPDARVRSASMIDGLTVALAAMGILGMLSGWWLLVLLSAALLVTSGLTMWLPGQLALCAATSALIAAAAVVGEAAAAFHQHLPGRGLVLLPLALGARLLLRDGVAPSGRTRSPSWRSAVVTAGPAIVACLIGLAQLLSTRLVAGWGLGGTDLAQHTVMLGQVQRAGLLDYGRDSYPRGLHMLIALCTSAPATDSSSLNHDLRVWGALTWLLFGLLLLASAAVTRQLAAAAALPERTALLLGLGTATVLLACRPLQVAFVYMGAAPSLLAVVVLWMLALPQLALRRLTLPFLAAAAFIVLAQLWQALLVAPAAVAVVEVVGLARARSLRRDALVRLCVAWLLAVAVAAPPVLALLRHGGLSLAATPGSIPSVPPAVGAVTAVALVLAAAESWRRGPHGILTVSSALLVVLAAFLRSSRHGLDLTSYYPMKVCWFIVLISAPLVATTAGRIWVATAVAVGPRLHNPSARRLVVVIAQALPFALVIALALPGLVSRGSLPRQAAGVGSLDDRGERRLALARAYGDRYAPARTLPVALALTDNAAQYGAYITSKLIRFRTGQPDTSGWVGSICKEARRVDDGHGVVVVTDLDVGLIQLLTGRQGCSGLEVVQVPGTDPRLVSAYEASVRQLMATGDL